MYSRVREEGTNPTVNAVGPAGGVGDGVVKTGVDVDGVSGVGTGVKGVGAEVGGIGAGVGVVCAGIGGVGAGVGRVGTTVGGTDAGVDGVGAAVRGIGTGHAWQALDGAFVYQDLVSYSELTQLASQGSPTEVGQGTAEGGKQSFPAHSSG